MQGFTCPVHAQALDVLEGSIVMQVRGVPPITLMPGQTFYDGRHHPSIAHVGRHWPRRPLIRHH